jgi:hypothetical protein
MSIICSTSPKVKQFSELTPTLLSTLFLETTKFPVIDIAIGHWRRIHAPPSDRDLIAYWAPKSRRLCWFIHSGGLSFRMDIPSSTVVTAKVYTKSPTRLAVCFDLNRPPTFLIQQPRSYAQLPPVVRSFPPLGVTAGEWASCRDWTEDNQASKVLRHEITGSPDTLLPAIACLSSVFKLDYAPSVTPPEPRNDQQPPRISVAVNAQAESVSSPSALSQTPPPTYREEPQAYANIAGFQQGILVPFPPGTGLHSPTLPVEMHSQTPTTVYPPSYSMIHPRQFVSTAEPPSFPPVMSESAYQAVSFMNPSRPTLAQPTYQAQHSGPFTSGFSLSPNMAPQGRSTINHLQTPGEALANGLARDSTMAQYRTSSTGHSAHSSIESIPTIPDLTTISGFSSGSTASLVPATPIDSLLARAPHPQHELHSQLQESSFPIGNALPNTFCAMHPSTDPNIGDWTHHPYQFMYPYIPPAHIPQEFPPYSASH